LLEKALDGRGGNWPLPDLLRAANLNVLGGFDQLGIDRGLASILTAISVSDSRCFRGKFISQLVMQGSRSQARSSSRDSVFGLIGGRDIGRRLLARRKGAG